MSAYEILCLKYYVLYDSAKNLHIIRILCKEYEIQSGVLITVLDYIPKDISNVTSTEP